MPTSASASFTGGASQPSARSSRTTASGRIISRMPSVPSPPTMVMSTWPPATAARAAVRSEEHTSELQSLMRISYAVFCLKKKTKKNQRNNNISNDNQTGTKQSTMNGRNNSKKKDTYHHSIHHTSHT